MKLSERLRDYTRHVTDGAKADLFEAANAVDALDAQAERIKALEGALRDTLECLDGCMNAVLDQATDIVFINTREKINQQEGPNWIAGMTARARALLGEK